VVDEEQMNEVGQLLQRMLPAGSAWILVAIPPHDAQSHAPGCCPVKTVTNLASEEQMKGVLEGAVAMFEQGSHQPMCARPVEKLVS